jgi:parallel beta-helix repeat protein
VTSGVGSAAVGSTRYTVPAGAIVVSPSGRDGAAGTAQAPLASVAAAVAKAPQGGTVVLRAGSYNQSVVVPSGKRVTIQSWPGEAVWFDGSVPVATWSRSGSTWVSPWTTFPSSKILGVADNPRFVDPANPMAARPDQVFVDGVPQRQVASASQVVAGTFFADPAGKRVVLGTAPTGREVRISNKTQALFVQGAGTTLQGFGVRRYATTDDERGAIRLGNDDLTARDLVIEDNAMIGLALERNRGSLERLTVRRNGMLGINASTAYDMALTRSLVTDNNASQFKGAPVSGGVKITRSRGVTVRDNEISRNLSGGLWLDESVYDADVVGNTLTDNQWFGIQLELTSKAVVADNTVTGGEVGIHLFDTNGVDVVNNSIGGFSKMGVKIEQDERRQATSGTGQDPRRPKPDPTVTWVTGDITIANNAFGAGGWFQVYVLDKATNRSADSMGIDIVGNAFNQRVTTSQATLVGWGGGDNKTVRRFDSVAALTAAKPAWRNVQTRGVLGLGDMLSFLTSSTAVAVPLTAEIAALVGQPVGTKRVGSF